MPARDGTTHQIGFHVDIYAAAEFGWESDESPTGWNYGTDSPTYSSYQYAAVGKAEISSVEFSKEYPAVVAGDGELSLEQSYEYFEPSVMASLLNPALYQQAVDEKFDKYADNLEPPEPDFDEPEPEPYDYDDRY